MFIRNLLQVKRSKWSELFNFSMRSFSLKCVRRFFMLSNSLIHTSGGKDQLTRSFSAVSFVSSSVEVIQNGISMHPIKLIQNSTLISKAYYREFSMTKCPIIRKQKFRLLLRSKKHLSTLIIWVEEFLHWICVFWLCKRSILFNFFGSNRNKKKLFETNEIVVVHT